MAIASVIAFPRQLKRGRKVARGPAAEICGLPRVRSLESLAREYVELQPLDHPRLYRGLTPDQGGIDESVARWMMVATTIYNDGKTMEAFYREHWAAEITRIKAEWIDSLSDDEMGMLKLFDLLSTSARREFIEAAREMLAGRRDEL